ncbi:hypothetical protein K466DRAFT_657408 [Polyporus arcularius HHB13444]|uniref:Transcription initiation factor TFIID subunit 4 n=1 Tax=Polyporus arcularius HHB13444 TaxID=1314778 RepID=A0A5C3PYH1_9APHY|nr:hypothetical protein K466DRAFT_657408 [Polyporus arcularius HHB13444]
MKAEDSQPPPATTTFSAAQWPQTSQIPIDPALQQQSQVPQHSTTTPYSHYQYGHYAQTSYSHYPQYAQQTHQPAAQASTSQTQTPTPAAQPVIAASTVIRPATQPAQQSQQSGVDTTDVATLNDALGSAGVDLRAEEESLQRTNDQYYSYRPYEDRSRKQPDKPQFDTVHLGNTMRTISARYKVPTVPKESMDYVALALRFRLQSLLTSMIAAAKHRTDTQFDRPASTYEDGTPMWSIKVRSDVGKQLEALQKAYREEDIKERRERKERQDAQAAQAAALTATANGAEGPGAEEEGGPKKKKKKEGPGVTARNMSEDVRKKMSNAVASQAAGLGTGKYAWMSAANAGAAAAKPKPAARASTPATTTAPAASSNSSASRWARPYQGSKTTSQQQQKDADGRLAITLADAVFVVNNEKGHGGGRGAARGWT